MPAERLSADDLAAMIVPPVTVTVPPPKSVARAEELDPWVVMSTLLRVMDPP
jgi:hypothetical protein